MSFTVTATDSSGNAFDDVGLKVYVITGASGEGTGSNAGPTGAEDGGTGSGPQPWFSSGSPLPPAWSMTPNNSGSVILNAIYCAGTGTFTTLTNNTVDDSFASANSGQAGRHIYQHYTGTVTGGTALTNALGGTDTGAGTLWYAIGSYEVPGSSPAIDASTPAAVDGSTSAATTASFNPPLGSVLVAMVTGNPNGAPSLSVSDTSGLGLVWTFRGGVATNGANGPGFIGYVYIWTATVGPPANPPAYPAGPPLQVIMAFAPQPITMQALRPRLTVPVQVPGTVTLRGNVGTATEVTSGNAITGSYGQTPTLAGSLLVAVVSIVGSTAGVPSIAGPSGWTRLLPTSYVSNIGVGSATAANCVVDIWYKAAAGGDAAPAFTISGPTTFEISCTCFELLQAATSSPLDTSGTESSGSSTATITTVTVTTAANVAAAGEFAICVATRERTAGAPTITYSASWTNAFNDGATSQVGHVGVAYRAGPPSGSTLSNVTTFSGTGTTAFSAGALVVIKAGTTTLAPLQLDDRVDTWQGTGQIPPRIYGQRPPAYLPVIAVGLSPPRPPPVPAQVIYFTPAATGGPTMGTATMAAASTMAALSVLLAPVTMAAQAALSALSLQAAPVTMAAGSGLTNVNALLAPVSLSLAAGLSAIGDIAAAQILGAQAALVNVAVLLAPATMAAQSALVAKGTQLEPVTFADTTGLNALGDQAAVAALGAQAAYVNVSVLGAVAALAAQSGLAANSILEAPATFAAAATLGSLAEQAVVVTMAAQAALLSGAQLGGTSMGANSGLAVAATLAAPVTMAVAAALINKGVQEAPVALAVAAALTAMAVQQAVVTLAAAAILTGSVIPPPAAVQPGGGNATVGGGSEGAATTGQLAGSATVGQRALTAKVGAGDLSRSTVSGQDGSAKVTKGYPH